MQNVLEYSSIARWTHFTLKEITENGMCKPLNLTFVGAQVGEDTSSSHGTNDSAFWHYRQTGRFLR